jgi:plasmid maintenance system antidote protein VapI
VQSQAMKIKSYIEARDGETITSFARTVGIDVSTMHRIVNEKHIPSAATMRKIVAATGGMVQPNDFFTSAP